MNTQNFERLGPPQGARIVLAGGAGGIGRALATACVENGYEVVVLDLAASMEAQTAQAEVQNIAFDGSDPQSITRACEEVGRDGRPVDGFVFLSGFPILPRRPITEVTVPQWDELMAVNLRSAYLLTAALLPQMRKATAPTLVTVAS